MVEHVDKRVKATGKIEYDEDMESRTITIEKFKVVEDENEE